jgi:hypothetical protein
MATRTDELLRILQQHFNTREEGWIWLALYVDEHEGGIVNQIEGHYEDPPGTARGLATLVNETGAGGAFVALCRSEGRPTEGDRELWRSLRSAGAGGGLGRHGGLQPQRCLVDARRGRSRSLTAPPPSPVAICQRLTRP